MKKKNNSEKEVEKTIVTHSFEKLFNFSLRFIQFL
jgi:hypothetical protein